MQMRILFAVIGLLIFNNAFGQNQDKYPTFVKEAWELYESKEYKKSAEKYKEAFDQKDGEASDHDRYYAACSYALSGDIENSFYHLFRLAEDSESKYANIGMIKTHKDLKILHEDKRWDKLVEIVRTNFYNLAKKAPRKK